MISQVFTLSFFDIYFTFFFTGIARGVPEGGGVLQRSNKKLNKNTRNKITKILILAMQMQEKSPLGLLRLQTRVLGLGTFFVALIFGFFGMSPTKLHRLYTRFFVVSSGLAGRLSCHTVLVLRLTLKITIVYKITGRRVFLVSQLPSPRVYTSRVVNYSQTRIVQSTRSQEKMKN